MDQFWAGTPAELAWEVEAWHERERSSRRETKQLAWLIAGLSRQKRLPALGKFLEDGEPTRKATTWQAMKATLRSLTNKIDEAQGRRP